MAWETNGNANTNPPGDFLGTTDNEPLVIKTNSTERLRVDPSGNVGIGTATPSAALHVAPGKVLRIEGGTSATDANDYFSFGGYGTFGIDAPGVVNGRLVVDPSGNVGIGTATPSAALHVAPGKVLRIEGGTSATDANDYFSFGGNGTFGIDAPGVVNGRLVVQNSGNVGIGTPAPVSRLSVVLPGTTEIAGTAASTTLRTSSASPGPASGDNSALASFGCPVEGNNVSLGVRLFRLLWQGQQEGWQSTAVGLSMDVDNTIAAGGALALYSNGDIGPARGGIFFADGSRQTTAQATGPQGPAGPQGAPGPQGPPGVSPPPQVILSRNTSGGGFISLLGPGGKQTVQLTGVVGAPNNGIISVTDAAGAAQGLFKAAMSVDSLGWGTIVATVKSFRVPHPVQPDMDIVYTCIEGPEAAAYVRGTAHLVNGEGVISLPEHFVSVVGLSGLTVQITPLSPDSLGLAVAEKGIPEIRIKELHGGTGNYDFDWEVKGIRNDQADYQVLRPRAERAFSQAERAFSQIVE